MIRCNRRAIRFFVASLAIATPNLGVAAAGSAATSAQGATCTNPASGTTWKITIDYAHSTVDANAAAISDAQITWHDAKDGGNYTLDRKSGKLTFVAASSTGGYFVQDHCSLDNPG